MSNFIIAEQKITVIRYDKVAYGIAKRVPPKERTPEQELLSKIDFRSMAFPVLPLPDGQSKRVRNNSMIVEFSNGNLDVVTETEFRNFAGGILESKEDGPANVGQESTKDSSAAVAGAITETSEDSKKSKPATDEPAKSEEAATFVGETDEQREKAKSELADVKAAIAENNRKRENTADEGKKPEPNPVARYNT